MSFRVEVLPRAVKDLRALPPEVRARVTDAIDALETEPRPPGVRPIGSAPAGSYRVRVGAYRIGYTVDDAEGLVRVWLIERRDRSYQEARRRGR